jgi:excisionase family DNA binding protein
MEATPREILAGPVCTVRAAAHVSKLSRPEIYSRAKSGELEAVNVGRRVLIKTDSLRQMLGLRDD